MLAAIPLESPASSMVVEKSCDEQGSYEPEQNFVTCKIDLKTWQFWGKKGLKTFTVAEKRVDVFWDLRAAKFAGSPEPDSGYYVVMVSDGEVVLLLGDQKKEGLRRSKSRPASEAALMVHKKEIVYASSCFCTKTTLGHDDSEHSIIIESSLHGPYDPEMWIIVDGSVSIRVPNLHWRFRGNETIAVNGFPVQILWDVHDWLYNPCHSRWDSATLFTPGRLDKDCKGPTRILHFLQITSNVLLVSSESSIFV